MSKWKQYFLCQIADIIVSNVDKHVREDELQVLLCNYMDVYSNRYLHAGHRFSTGSVAPEEYEKFRLIANDVIITKDSETPDDIGVPAVVIESIPDLVCGYHLAILRPKKEVLDGRFLMQLLQADWIKSHFGKHANGSTRFGLSRNAIDKLECLIPDYPVQQKIASILAAADETIAATSAAIEKYKAIRQGLLQDLFTHGIDVRTGKLRDKATFHFVLKEGLEVPERWEVLRLEKVAGIIDPQPDHRTPPPQEAGVPYLGINDIRTDGLVLLERCRKVSQKTLAEQQVRFTLRKGDIIFGKIGTIGQPKKITTPEGVALSANVILIQPKINSGFVFWYLNSQFAQEQVLQTIHATTQAAFGMDKVRNLIIAVPSEEEQASISKSLDALENYIQFETTYLAKLQSLKQGLMADLLSGRKTVSISEKAKPHSKSALKHERV